MQFFKDVWNTVYDFAVTNFRTILLFVAFLIGGFIAAKIAMRILKRIVNRSKLHGTAGNFLLTLAKTAIAALYVIILLSMLGVDTTSLVAIFSVLTLAISLAVQDVIANLASGSTGSALVCGETSDGDQLTFKDLFLISSAGGIALNVGSGKGMQCIMENCKIYAGASYWFVDPNFYKGSAYDTNNFFYVACLIHRRKQ